MVSQIVYLHPYLGKIPILTNIFQMGWNHQPETWFWGSFCCWSTSHSSFLEWPWNNDAIWRCQLLVKHWMIGSPTAFRSWLRYLMLVSKCFATSWEKSSSRQNGKTLLFQMARKYQLDSTRSFFVENTDLLVTWENVPLGLFFHNNGK